MHRRQFINAAAGALLLPSGLARARQQEVPAATPQHHGRPRPIVLGDGIELIDYRIYPSQDVPRIIGEISSTRDDMVDSPVVSITFPELEDAGRAYAPPLLPVMRPGESNMIFGVLPDGVDSDAMLDAASYHLCQPVGHSTETPKYLHLRLEIEILEESFSDDGFRIRVRVYNRSENHVRYPNIRSMVRDEKGRIAGTLPSVQPGRIVSGGNRTFEVQLSPSDRIQADPRAFIEPGSTYELEMHGGLADRQINIGCPTLYSSSGHAVRSSWKMPRRSHKE